jgi:hypothetical protein
MLLRAAFWLSVVVVLLPGDKDTGDQAPRVTVFQTLSAAQSTVSDLSQFCSRNPDACATGGTMLAAFGDKVRYGARLISHTFTDPKGTTPASSGGTLQPADKDLPWHAPPLAKPAGAA